MAAALRRSFSFAFYIHSSLLQIIPLCDTYKKQEGSLCAQHCLNALLQGSYFTAVDLADIARQLDESERQQMAEAGTDSEEYRLFVEQPSQNFDDSGYFSVQVLSTALRVWDLELLPFNSSDTVAIGARTDPRSQNAFICNFRDHWFSVRKLGHQWFNLNSLLTGPELLSDTYLTLFLTQLQQEGYSIFVISGHLPGCEANEVLMVMEAVQSVKPQLLSELTDTDSTGVGVGTSSTTIRSLDDGAAQALEESEQIEEQELQAAIHLSMLDSNNSNNAVGVTTENSPVDTVQADDAQAQSPSVDVAVTPSVEEVRKRRLAFLQKVENQPSTSSNVTGARADDVTGSTAGDGTDSSGGAITGASGDTRHLNMSEEEMLAKAITMSMQT